VVFGVAEERDLRELAGKARVCFEGPSVVQRRVVAKAAKAPRREDDVDVEDDAADADADADA